MSGPAKAIFLSYATQDTAATKRRALIPGQFKRVQRRIGMQDEL
jgi:hypothetical protein